MPGWWACAFVIALIGCSSGNSNGNPNTGGTGGTMIGGSGGGAGQGDAGGSTDAAAEWTDCHDTPAGTPPPTIPLTPTVCASPGGCTASALTYLVGSCGAYSFWQRTNGYQLTECLFGANDVLVGERTCTDTAGCRCRGTHVAVTACVDAGTATTTTCGDAASN